MSAVWPGRPHQSVTASSRIAPKPLTALKDAGAGHEDGAVADGAGDRAEDRRARRRVVPLVVGLVVALAAAWAVTVLMTDEPSPVARAFGERDMWEVAEDDDATPAEIVEAGRAWQVERSGAGQLVVGYLVQPNDDEGPHKTAWRLYDGDGEQLAEGYGPASDEAYPYFRVLGLEDGFLLRVGHEGQLQHLAPDGTVSPVPQVAAGPTRPGDQVVAATDGIGPVQVYRPDPGGEAGSVLPAPQPPGVRPDRMRATVVDATGAAWVLVERGPGAVEVHRSIDGAGAWDQLDDLGLPEGTYAGSFALAGDQAVVVVLQRRGLHSLLVRDVSAEASQDWRRVELGLKTGVEPWFDTEVGVLDDSRLLLTAEREVAYVVDPSTGESTHVSAPASGDDWSIDQSGPWLHARSYEPAAFEDPQGERLLAWESADLGEGWEKIPR